MSRKDVTGSDRCPTCGGKMRLVNVTWVNTFRTPEASQYDLSVSNRKAMFGNAAMSSSQEMMCKCCGQRLPSLCGKPVKRRKAAELQQANGQESENARKGEKNGFVRFIKIFISIAILAAAVYCGYKYQEGICDFVYDLIEKIK